MKKRLLAIGLSVLLIATSSMAVFAADTKENSTSDSMYSQQTEETEKKSISDLTQGTDLTIQEKGILKSIDMMPQIYAGNSLSSATTMTMNKKYSGTISDSNTQDFYKFTLSTSGRVKLSSVASIENVTYILYDAKGIELWSEYYNWNANTGQSVVEKNLDLVKGTYYLAVQQKWDYTGNYSASLSFISSEETYEEVQGGNNNLLSMADTLSMSKQYKGQIALNDDRDFYKFTLSTSGRVSLSSTANMEYVTYILYDAKGNELWSQYYNWNSSTQYVSLSKTFDLVGGTYYLEVLQKWGYTGNYSLKTTFTTAGESFKETQQVLNNSTSSANKINFNTTYKGQIGFNDSKDFYRVELPVADTIKIKSTANMEYVTYKMFTSDGSEIWNSPLSANSSSNKCTLDHSLSLSAGTYYFEVEERWDATGTYSFSINSSKVKTPVAVSGLRIGGRAADALRLNWNKSANSSGYIVEQYKSGQWTRIARIGSANTLTYRISGLSQATTYQFRVKSFGYSGSTPIYSGYTYINGKTNPSTVTGLKIGGRATDALRLNWNRNTKASGYIVEQYKSGQWTRIARIGSNSTVTYRVEKLASGTTYKFRVRAFAYDGSTPIYGGYQNISGTTISKTTTPASVSGLKIGGRAADALRLNWNKSANASGYIVEQYKSGKWTRIARIGSANTLTYRISGLSQATTYQFRVKSFGYSGSTPIYSGYTYKNGKTNPSVISGLRIGGTAKDALRLNWNRNTKASGYIVEQFKNGQWVRIARIGTNSTLTYRVEQLKAGTSYVFRAKSFAYDGNTPIYSGYQYTSGTTNR